MIHFCFCSNARKRRCWSSWLLRSLRSSGLARLRAFAVSCSSSCTGSTAVGSEILISGRTSSTGDSKTNCARVGGSQAGQPPTGEWIAEPHLQQISVRQPLPYISKFFQRLVLIYQPDNTLPPFNQMCASTLLAFDPGFFGTHVPENVQTPVLILLATPLDGHHSRPTAEHACPSICALLKHRRHTLALHPPQMVSDANSDAGGGSSS